MSHIRQIRSLAVGYPSGREVEPHRHRWDQLVYGATGVLTVRTEQGSWVVPTQRAVWVPAHVEHGFTASGFVSLRTLYFPEGAVARLPRCCSVVEVSPLLRELIHHCVEVGVIDAEADPDHVHLVAVVHGQLRHRPLAALHLPWPTDPRARQVARALELDPSQRTTLSQVCRRSGATTRTVERLFRRETGLTLARWRAQLRVLAALPKLAAGDPVTCVALEVGYDSPSAFIATFRRTLGCTPGRYYR